MGGQRCLNIIEEEGLVRDSGRLGKLGYFDERDPAVKEAVRMLIEGAHRKGKTPSRSVVRPHRSTQTSPSTFSGSGSIRSLSIRTRCGRPGG